MLISLTFLYDLESRGVLCVSLCVCVGFFFLKQSCKTQDLANFDGTCLITLKINNSLQAGAMRALLDCWISEDVRLTWIVLGSVGTDLRPIRSRTRRSRSCRFLKSSFYRRTWPERWLHCAARDKAQRKLPGSPSTRSLSATCTGRCPPRHPWWTRSGALLDGRLQGSSRHPELGGDPLQADTGSPPVTQGNSGYALSERAERHLFPKCGPGQKQINFEQACTQLKWDGRDRFSGQPTSFLLGDGSDVNKRLHRDAPRWQGCQHPEIRVTTLTEAWTRRVTRVTRAFLISESGASPPCVSDNAARVYSCSHWREGWEGEGGGLRHKSIRAWAARPRTVKETVPHGRDVIKPQLTGTTQRPSEGDAQLFASCCTFCSAEHARVREPMGEKPGSPSRGRFCHAVSLDWNFISSSACSLQEGAQGEWDHCPLFSCPSQKKNLPTSVQHYWKNPSSVVCKRFPLEQLDLDHHGASQGESQCGLLVFFPVILESTHFHPKHC